MKKVCAVLLLVSVVFCGSAMGSVLQPVSLANFDDLTLGNNSSWNGSDGSGGFTSGGAYFKNNYNSTYYSWDGFAYSSKTASTASGWSTQFNAITGSAVGTNSGQNGSAKYAVGYDPMPSFFGIERPTMTLTSSRVLDGLYITNTNFAYYAMLRGDAYSKKFGGTSGNDADWFKLAITGKDAQGLMTGTVDFYLADFRFNDNSQDYIINTWQYVDLTSLGEVKSVEFALSSTDNGQWGMNTPAYFALDTVVPEPATMAILGLGMLLIRKKK